MWRFQAFKFRFEVDILIFLAIFFLKLGNFFQFSGHTGGRGHNIGYCAL
jgi:hypothetical protein